MFASTSETMAVLSRGDRRGKFEPSRSSTSKKIYEQTIITQTMEMARQRSEELKDRKQDSMGLFPVQLAIGNFISCQAFKAVCAFSLLTRPTRFSLTEK